MKLYKFSYFFEFRYHSGHLWATSRYDVEHHIFALCHKATGVDIWID